MGLLRIGDHEYRTEKLDTREQLHVARRLHPLVGALRDTFLRGSVLLFRFLPKEEGQQQPEEEKFTLEFIARELDALEPFTTAIGRMEDADADYVMNKCLAKCYRAYRNPSTGEVVSWNPVIEPISGRVMYDDITLDQVMQLIWGVASESLGNFTFVKAFFQGDT